VPGTPIVLTRGERVAITVVNRLPQHTNVHWHGMELESYYDGVSGWSGADARRTPLVAPGDSFSVTFTPPRAGTFMYHTHMEEEPQLQRGLCGPMIVLEPGQIFDPQRDFVMMIGERPDTSGRGAAMLNGRIAQVPLELQTGATYRFRLINILPAEAFHYSLTSSDTVLQWTPRAKDGADLPDALTHAVAAEIILGAGEAYDFTWTAGGREAELRARHAFPGANPLSACRSA
jgi:FtsP/CotA-like multicopper oxidase with cupredoxin domain